MVEVSRPWGGTVLGDAGPYSNDNWTDIFERFLGAFTDGDTGVLSNVANELVVTGAVSPMSVDSGVALVNGTYYISDAAVSVAIGTPAVSTRIDRVVLRKTWATQVVRITLIAGVEGGGAPALTQTDGVTWDMPLFQASITTGGAITLTDERERLFTRHPSMTTAERDAMTAVNGMMINNETAGEVQFRSGGAWVAPGIPDLVSDPSPQAGADLDLQANLLVGNGGATGIAISAAGEVNMAATPCVLAHNAGNINNVTGNGTLYTLVYGTEIFDQNADFDGTSTFTAPVTGRYLVVASMELGGITAAGDEMLWDVVTSNRTHRLLGNPQAWIRGGPPGDATIRYPYVVDMDAADTLTVEITSSGEAGDVQDSKGDANMSTAIGVYLMA